MYYRYFVLGVSLYTTVRQASSFYKYEEFKMNFLTIEMYECKISLVSLTNYFKGDIMETTFLLYLNLVNTSKIYKDQLNEVLNPYNISGPHFQAMVCIKEFGEKSLTELAETLLVEKPTATKILQKLVLLDYLETTTGADKRRKKIVFTEDGKRKFAGVLQDVENFRSELMAGFSEDEIDMAITVLTEMQNRLKARNTASI